MEADVAVALFDSGAVQGRPGRAPGDSPRKPVGICVQGQGRIGTAGLPVSRGAVGQPEPVQGTFARHSAHVSDQTTSVSTGTNVTDDGNHGSGHEVARSK